VLKEEEYRKRLKTLEYLRRGRNMEDKKILRAGIEEENSGDGKKWDRAKYSEGG
jgi:hypothetical protein